MNSKKTVWSSKFVENEETRAAVSDIAKKNNIPITKSNIDPVIEEKPKKRFVVDEFGIMKIAEDIPEKEQKVLFSYRII